MNKRVFFFWGNSPMSWMRYMTLVSFRHHNPDWRMTLYLSDSDTLESNWVDTHIKQDFNHYKGTDYLQYLDGLDIEIKQWDRLPHIAPSHKSNFFKWSMLYEEGGIYSDMDILWTAPIDRFYDHAAKHDMAICCTNYFSIGLLASQEGSPFFKACYEHALKSYTPNRYQCVGVENIYHMLYNDKTKNDDLSINWNMALKGDLLQMIRDRFSVSIYNIPMSLVYSLNHDKIADIFGKGKAAGIGLHWYAGNQLSQKYNCTLNELNYLDYDNLFCKEAAKCLM